MKEYIERASVHSIIEQTSTLTFTRGKMHEQVDSLPAADVAEVRHGKIIETIKDGKMNRVFSCCGHDFTELTCWYMPKYCPNCGARMGKEANHGN